MIRARLSLAIQTALFSDSLTIIPHPIPLVKRFWKSFFNFFAVFFADPLVVSLHIIALLFLFVKDFLTTFCTLESSAVCHKNVVAFLCNITIAFPFLTHERIFPLFYADRLDRSGERMV